MDYLPEAEATAATDNSALLPVEIAGQTVFLSVREMDGGLGGGAEIADRRPRLDNVLTGVANFAKEIVASMRNRRVEGVGRVRMRVRHRDGNPGRGDRQGQFEIHHYGGPGMGQLRNVNDPGPGPHDLLRAATLALEVPGQAGSGPARATGFFVAPGIVATCAHVLSDALAGLPERVVGRLPDGRSVECGTVPEWYLRAEPGGPDLAFLRADPAADTAGVPHVLLSGALAVDDPGLGVRAPRRPVPRWRAGQASVTWGRRGCGRAVRGHRTG